MPRASSTVVAAALIGMNGESKPTDMTETLLPKKKADGRGWAWDAVGPGAALYTKDGTLVIPAQHRNIYSTDHGKTWKVQKLGEETGEATITQLDDGTLYRNDRPTGGTWNLHKRRWVARGSISGGFGKNARTWERSRPFSEGPKPPYYGGEEGGYSSMAKTADFMVGALVESNLNPGDRGSSRSILFRKFNIPWAVNGCTC